MISLTLASDDCEAADALVLDAALSVELCPSSVGADAPALDVGDAPSPGLGEFRFGGSPAAPLVPKPGGRGGRPLGRIWGARFLSMRLIPAWSRAWCSKLSACATDARARTRAK